MRVRVKEEREKTLEKLFFLHHIKLQSLYLSYSTKLCILTDAVLVVDVPDLSQTKALFLVQFLFLEVQTIVKRNCYCACEHMQLSYTATCMHIWPTQAQQIRESGSLFWIHGVPA